MKLEQCFRRKTYVPHLSDRPIVKKGCIYNLSFFCVCMWSMGAIFQNLSPSVTLKMGSRSPKSNGSRSQKFNQFLFLSQQYSCTSLVKIRPFILEIVYRKAIFQQSEPPVALTMGQGHQNLISSFSCHNNIVVKVWSKSIHSFMIDFGQTIFKNLSPCVTLKIGSRSPKSNQFFFMSQQYSCASLVKIHPFLHEIGCRQAIFQQSKTTCDLENGVKVTKI